MSTSKVLLVEDHPISRRLLQAMLRKSYTVIEASSGREAIEIAEKEKPDLVLLDIELPHMDGFQTLEKLREGPIDEAVPVLFITARSDAKSREAGLAAGAVDYLTKPYDRHELLFKVRNHLALYKARKEIEKTNQIMARELEMASQLQHALLPQSFPNAERLRFLVDYRPSSEAGGDFYDVIEIPGDWIAFAQVDVAGHGVHSAMIGAMFKMALQTFVRQTWTPSNLLSTINDEMVRMLPLADFLTVFYGAVNSRTLELVYSRAGHPMPFLYSKRTEKVTELHEGGPILGAYPDIQFEQGRTRLDTGDRILVFTDGATEATGSTTSDMKYGKERLREILVESSDMSPTNAMAHITGDLVEFRGGSSFDDDLSLMLMAVR